MGMSRKFTSRSGLSPNPIMPVHEPASSVAPSTTSEQFQAAGQGTGQTTYNDPTKMNPEKEEDEMEDDEDDEMKESSNPGSSNAESYNVNGKKDGAIDTRTFTENFQAAEQATEQSSENMAKPTTYNDATKIKMDPEMEDNEMEDDEIGMGPSFQQERKLLAPQSFPTVDKFERAGSGGNVPETVEVFLKGGPNSVQWNSPGGKKEHYQKHVKGIRNEAKVPQEFGDITEDQYIESLKEFAESKENAVKVTFKSAPKKLKKGLENGFKKVRVIKIEGARFAEDGKLVFEKECKILITNLGGYSKEFRGNVKTYFKWDQDISRIKNGFEYPLEDMVKRGKRVIKREIDEGNDKWKAVEKLLKTLHKKTLHAGEDVEEVPEEVGEAGKALEVVEVVVEVGGVVLAGAAAVVAAPEVAVVVGAVAVGAELVDAGG